MNGNSWKCLEGLKACNFYCHGWWTSLLGLHTMNNQTINFYILMDFSLLLTAKNIESLDDDLLLDQPQCAMALRYLALKQKTY